MPVHLRQSAFIIVTASLLLGSVSLPALAKAKTTDTDISTEEANKPSSVGLSLQQAINKTLEQSPRVQGAGAAVKAAAAELNQASALPNPVLSAEIENFGGRNSNSIGGTSYNGFDSAENTLAVSQLIEIGGKRSARAVMAEHGQVLSRLEQSAVTLDLIRDVKIAYMKAVAAQEEMRLAEQQSNLATKILSNVNTRVNAAAEPIIQRNKATIALATAEIASEKAKRSQTIAMKNLALLWGDNTAPAQLDADDFYKVEAPQQIATASLENTPDFQRDSAAFNRAQAAVELEEANAIPNPTISAGVRDFRQSDSQAFVVGVSIPLPVFNLNSGNVERARQEAVQANANRHRSLLEKQSRLNENEELLQASYMQISQFKEKILPQSEEALKQAQRGYGLGRFAFLDVLDAQRTMADSRLAYVNALLDYHNRNAEIERLTAEITPDDNQERD